MWSADDYVFLHRRGVLRPTDATPPLSRRVRLHWGILAVYLPDDDLDLFDDLAGENTRFLFGIPAFFAYGVIRVLGLGIIGHLMPSWVSFFHIYLMGLLNLGFLIYLWAFWVNRWTLNPPKAS
jgi:hypothetical protein